MELAFLILNQVFLFAAPATIITYCPHSIMNRIISRRISVIACLFLSMTPALRAQIGVVSEPKPGAPYTLKPDLSEPGERTGLRCISDKPFPVPSGAEVIPLPGGDLETDGKMPSGWQGDKGSIVTAADAPQGKAYFKMEVVNGFGFHTPDITVKPGRPYFLSFWLKCPSEQWACITFQSDERLQSTSVNIPYIPGTGNKWKRVGIYFWFPVPSKSLKFHIMYRGQPELPGQFICVDDVQLRTASEAEMATAYEAERSHLPPYDLTPGPGDGQNLALSVAKWEGKAGIPGKPFVIWAIGSSWTEAQRDGYGLMHAIHKNFPKAPPIVYHEHDGGGTPWDYAAGWAQGFVAADQPDLVFTYTPGSPEGLDLMLTNIRKLTTADIIVPSIHFGATSPMPMSPNDIENGYTNWAKVREICKKHHAEFVEHRRQMAEYHKTTSLTPDDLLWDHAHQNQHGRIRIWDSIARHITDPKQFTYDPTALERRIAVNPPAATATEKVTLVGNWAAANGSVLSRKAGNRIKVHFTGNRIDLIGRKAPGGGTIKVFVDGASADQAPAFYTNYIQAKPKVWPQAIGGQQGDHAPHAVTLGKNVVPQSWKIVMISDTGDFRIEGSVTGPDGEGNAAQPFVSKSGQISIDPKLWRNNKVEKDSKTLYGMVTGDLFTFDVTRCANGTVAFQAEKAEPFSVPLVQSLTNSEHTLEIVTEGAGEVAIDGLYVFQPMEK